MTRRRQTTSPRRRRRRNRRTTTRPPRLRGDVGRRIVGALSWVFGALALVGAATGLYFGWNALRDTGRLQVQSIEVRGAQRANWNELRAYTGIAVGDPILDVDLDGAALGLRRHPWIESATVRRRLPDKITLDLVEHQPAILVSVGEVYIANPEGEIFKRLDAQDGIATPMITGLRREDTANHPVETAAVIRDGIALAAAAGAPDVEGRLGRLEELHWDRDLGWSIVCSVGRRPPRTIHLGRDPVPRLDIALAAVRRLDALHRVPRVIWADGTKHPRRVQVAFGRAVDSKDPPTLIAKAGD